MEVASIHNHSCYSMPDGLMNVDSLLKSAARKDAWAVALTDHGTVSGFFDWDAATSGGIKKIFGCEYYYTFQGITHHLIGIAKNSKGLHNLFKLNKLAQGNFNNRRPLLTKRHILKNNEGVVFTSACIAGPLNLDYLDAKKEAEWWQANTEFYIELQFNVLKKQEKHNEKLVNLSDLLGIPIVVSSDAHYESQDDQKFQRGLLQLRNWDYDCPDLVIHNYQDFHLSCSSKYHSYIDGWIENTNNLASMCEELSLSKSLKYPKVVGVNTKSEFVGKCYDNLLSKFNNNPAYMARLQAELKVIDNKQLFDYFYIIDDYVEHAKKHTLVGAGRGSACGSLALYLAGVHRVDPIKFDIGFERFLSVGRGDTPDVDLDFGDPEVVKSYLKEKYGGAYQMSTFGKWTPKTIVNGFLKMQGVEYRDRLKITKGILDSDDFETSDEYKSLDAEYGFNWRRFYELSLDNVSYIGTHPGGVIITPDDREVPLVSVKRPKQEKREIQTTIIEGHQSHIASDYGYLKFDVLGLKTLRTIEECVGIEGILDHTYEDGNVWRTIQEAPYGLFQFTQTYAREILRNFKPRKMDELAALTSLNRPGVLSGGSAQFYLDRKHHVWDSRIANDILRVTNGVMLYQDQVLELAKEIAGFNEADATELRALLTKQGMEDEDRLKEVEEQFYSKSMVEPEETQLLWKAIESQGGYAFNKAHAYSYSIITYWCAHLLTYRRNDYLVAMLNNSDDFKNDMKHISTVIEFVPPAIESHPFKYSIVNDKMAMPLVAIKGIGIKNAMKYKSGYKLIPKIRTRADEIRYFGIPILTTEWNLPVIIDNPTPQGNAEWGEVKSIKETIDKNGQLMGFVDYSNIENEEKSIVVFTQQWGGGYEESRIYLFRWRDDGRGPYASRTPIPVREIDYQPKTNA